MTRLVFIHGRAQEHLDAAQLKADWISAWEQGLAKSGLSLPIGESDIRFPYYGDTLFDLAQGRTHGEAAAVIVKGTDTLTGQGPDAQERAFVTAAMRELQDRVGITDAEIAAQPQMTTLQKGPLNWGWVQQLLATVDRRVPLASGASIALATHDVWQYLDNVGVRDEIEGGVRQAMVPEVPTVVVSHSLGTVVAYNLLRREGASQRWNVPLLVTLGSPLAVSVIRKRLAPNRHPACVARWFNAFDPRDVVALYPLDPANFPLEPPVINKSDVDNPTSNRHGISGYLSDAQVARTIHAALAG